MPRHHTDDRSGIRVTDQNRSGHALRRTDAPLVVSRKGLLNAIQDVQRGSEPPRMTIKAPSNRSRNIVSLYGTIPSSTDWKEYCREKE